MTIEATCLPGRRVYLTRSEAADYTEPARVDAPELDRDVPVTQALAALRRLLAAARLDASRYGTPHWNPLGALIRPGQKLLVKPNWVADRNQGSGGIDCLVTHSSLIEAVLHYVVKADQRASSWATPHCRAATSKPCWRPRATSRSSARAAPGNRIALRDFRRVILVGKAHSANPRERTQADDYVLFDLAGQSDLEPITGLATPFRVTMYDPRPGAHARAGTST